VYGLLPPPLPPLPSLPLVWNESTDCSPPCLSDVWCTVEYNHTYTWRDPRLLIKCRHVYMEGPKYTWRYPSIHGGTQVYMEGPKTSHQVLSLIHGGTQVYMEGPPSIHGETQDFSSSDVIAYMEGPKYTWRDPSIHGGTQDFSSSDVIV